MACGYNSRVPADRALAALLMCFAVCHPAAAQTSETHTPNRLLDQLASIIRDNIYHLPNYTCTLTIDRHQSGYSKPGSCRCLTRLRLDVAIGGGKELYAWPGSRGFKDRPLQEIRSNGKLQYRRIRYLLRRYFSRAAQPGLSMTESRSSTAAGSTTSPTRFRGNEANIP